MSKIPEGKLVIADKGYTGAAMKVETRNKSDSQGLNNLKKRAKV